MRKFIIVITLVVSVGLLASAALACYWDGYYGGPMGGPAYGPWGGYAPGAAPSGAYQNFLDDTTKLRQDLAAKQGQYSALMAQANPDPKKIGQLSQEIAGLHDQLRTKAQGSGLAGPRPYGGQMGPGPYGYGSGYGGWNCW
jgi:zinc resistance-associated protein